MLPVGFLYSYVARINNLGIASLFAYLLKNKGSKREFWKEELFFLFPEEPFSKKFLQ